MSEPNKALFPSVAAGEEVMPEMTGYKMACCDCGLVHTMNFKVREVVSVSDDGTIDSVEPDNVDSLRVVLTAFRDDIETDATRADIVKYLDELLETQGRLLFAKSNYNEDEAEAFGVAVLDFMRLHGQAVRTALVAHLFEERK